MIDGGDKKSCRRRVYALYSVSMGFDPESAPEAAQALTALLAAGEHVEVLSSCPACRGSYTAVIKRTLVPRVSRACMFCNSSQVSVLVVDPQEESQMT